MKREELIGTYDRVMLRAESGVELFAHIIIAEHDERLHYAVTVSAGTSYFTKLDRAIEFYNQQVSAIEFGIEVVSQ